MLGEQQEQQAYQEQEQVRLAAQAEPFQQAAAAAEAGREEDGVSGLITSISGEHMQGFARSLGQIVLASIKRGTEEAEMHPGSLAYGYHTNGFG